MAVPVARQSSPLIGVKNLMQPLLPHLCLVITCALYMTAGATVFYLLERPYEMKVKEETLKSVNEQRRQLLDTLWQLLNQSPAKYSEKEIKREMEVSIDDYCQRLMDHFDRPLTSTVFESADVSSTEWSPSAALLFAATSAIPVGYGFVAPVTQVGRCVLVIYGLIGIPLTLMTIADLASFLSCFILKTYQKLRISSAGNGPEETVNVPIGFILLLLISYPLIAALLFTQVSTLSYRDSLYFSLVTIFTIGFGDMQPPVGTGSVIVFIIGGVVLVTMSLELVASQVIHHIHYMGRQMGRAKEVANKMAKIAHDIHLNMNLSVGLAQMGAFARFGLLNTKAEGEKEMWLEPNSNRKQAMAAFQPDLSDIAWADVSSSFINPSTEIF